MVLTAIAIMGIIALYVTETKASGFSRHSTEARCSRRTGSSSCARSAPAVAVVLTDEPTSTSAARPGGIYTRVTTETVTANYADIVVEVDWSDDGIAHQVMMRARRGL